VVECLHKKKSHMSRAVQIVARLHNPAARRTFGLQREQRRGALEFEARRPRRPRVDLQHHAALRRLHLLHAVLVAVPMQHNVWLVVLDCQPASTSSNHHADGASQVPAALPACLALLTWACSMCCVYDGLAGLQKSHSIPSLA